MLFHYDAERISDLEGRMRNTVAALEALERKAEGNKVQLDNISDDEGEDKLSIKEVRAGVERLRLTRESDWAYLTRRSDNCVERLGELERQVTDLYQRPAPSLINVLDRLEKLEDRDCDIRVELGRRADEDMHYLTTRSNAFILRLEKLEENIGMLTKGLAAVRLGQILRDDDGVEYDGGDAQVWLEKIVAMAERHDALDTSSNHGGLAGAAYLGLEARCVTHGWWREIYELADAELGSAEGGIEARDQIMQAIRDAAKYRKWWMEVATAADDAGIGDGGYDGGEYIKGQLLEHLEWWAGK